MKRFILLACSAVLFISGISAFAEPVHSFANNQATTTYDLVNTPAAEVQSWVGLTGAQLVVQMGAPDAKSIAANGDSIYDYDQPVALQDINHRGAISQFQYDIDANGMIVSEASSILG
jgi:hypothetical protein